MPYPFEAFIRFVVADLITVIAENLPHKLKQKSLYYKFITLFLFYKGVKKPVCGFIFIAVNGKKIVENYAVTLQIVKKSAQRYAGKFMAEQPRRNSIKSKSRHS